jgi:CO/xanthine dehydrogenase Mo-binding subunit
MMEFKVVNQAEKKVDFNALVKGKPVFTEDLAPEGTLVVKLLKSPHAHARITHIDKEDALKTEGIECVITHKDIKQIPYTRAGQGFPEPSPYDTCILSDKVRFVGDAVAIVAGRTITAVKKALKKIKVEYEVLEPVLDFEKAMDECSPVIHDEANAENIYDAKKNLASHYEMSIGNVSELIANSDIQLEGTYYYPKAQQVPMENHTTLTYFDEKDRLVVVSSTQVPFHARRILSKVLEIPMRNIRVIKPRIGGGFGAKQGVIIEGFTSLVTLKTGKPAMLVLSRGESLINTYTRHDMKVTVKIGADKEGKLTAIDMYALSNTGAYGDHALTVAMVCGSKTLPLYNKVEGVRFVSDIVYTNLPSAGAYRGYGAPQGLLALDAMLDELSYAVGKDPIVVKEMNTMKEGETSPIFKIMGEGKEGVAQTAKSCKLDECIRRGKELSHWDEKFTQYKNSLFSEKAKASGKIRGIGCALAMQGSGIAKVDMASATIKMNDDGSFNLLVGATDLGTGSDTILSQIAAEELNVPLEYIHIYSSDTDRTPFDVGAYASSTTYVSGNAVVNTAKLVKKQILENAAMLLECDETKLYLEDGTVKSEDGEKSLSFAELCTKLFYNVDQKQIGATGSFVGDESPIPFMASFQEIEIDIETGKITPIEIVSIVDCGKTINPALAKGQIEGATLQALGPSLYEELTFNAKGSPTNASLFRYKIPDRSSYGKVTAETVDSYEPTGPFGAKSVSEIGIDTPGVTILNAIYNATGIRFNSIPVTPEMMLKAIKEKLQSGE